MGQPCTVDIIHRRISVSSIHISKQQQRKEKLFRDTIIAIGISIEGCGLSRTYTCPTSDRFAPRRAPSTWAPLIEHIFCNDYSNCLANNSVSAMLQV